MVILNIIGSAVKALLSGEAIICYFKTECNYKNLVGYIKTWEPHFRHIPIANGELVSHRPNCLFLWAFLFFHKWGRASISFWGNPGGHREALQRSCRIHATHFQKPNWSASARDLLFYELKFTNKELVLCCEWRQMTSFECWLPSFFLAIII